MKKTLLLILAIFFVSASNMVKANHVMGGDVTYRCSGGSGLIFTVTVYTDCSGISFGQATVTLQNDAGISAITCSYKSSTEVTPECNSTGTGGLNQINCNSGSLGGQRKFIFESLPISMSGVPVPGPSGYTFYTATLGTGNLPCCRNTLQNMASCSNITLRTKIYGYGAHSGNPNNIYWAGNICDNSPSFVQNQPSVQFNTSTEKVLSNLARDQDHDSLVYEFSSPWVGLNQTCSFASPYSFNNPFPSIIPNVNGSGIDKNNGIIRFITSQQGNFQGCVVVKSYKYGQLVSEIFRDFLLMVLAPPAGLNLNNTAPVITTNFPQCNATDTSAITLFVGDTLNFTVQAIDTNAGQQVKLYAQSSIFGNANNSLSTGCINPPCAQMFGFPGTPQEFLPPSAIVERNDTIGYGFTGLNGAGFRIQWATICANFASANPNLNVARTFTITITAKDDQCPVNEIAYKVIHIRLLPKPKLDHPKIECISINNQGFVELALSNSFDSTTIYDLDLCKNGNDSTAALSSSIARRLSSFDRHEIFRSTNPNGPFTIAGTINTFLSTSNLTQFVDSSFVNFNGALYYFARTKSACYLSDFTGFDTLSTMYLNPSHQNNMISLDWNQISTNQAATINNPYQIDSGFVRNGNFTLVNSFATTTSLNFSTPFPPNNDTLATRVRIENPAAGCVSSSNVSKLVLGNGVGVRNQNLKNWNIFPNPSEGFIQIELENKGTTTLSVHNMLGQLVKTVIITQNITNLNLSELPSGAYLITADGFETRRFVKF